MSVIDEIAKKTIEEISAELAQIGGVHDEFIQQSQKAKIDQPQSHSHIQTFAFDTHLDTASHNVSSQGISQANSEENSTLTSSSAFVAPATSNAFTTQATTAQSHNSSTDFVRGDMINPEYLFLRNLKERIEVLFEGLGQTKASESQERLELTLKFLEFLLATVQNRLENIAK